MHIVNTLSTLAVVIVKGVACVDACGYADSAALSRVSFSGRRQFWSLREYHLLITASLSKPLSLFPYCTVSHQHLLMTLAPLL